MHQLLTCATLLAALTGCSSVADPATIIRDEPAQVNAEPATEPKWDTQAAATDAGTPDAAPVKDSYAVYSQFDLGADGSARITATCNAGDTTSLDACICNGYSVVELVDRFVGVDTSGRMHCTCDFRSPAEDAGLQLYVYATTTCR